MCLSSKRFLLFVAISCLIFFLPQRIFSQDDLRDQFPEFFVEYVEFSYATLYPVLIQLALDEGQESLLQEVHTLESELGFSNPSTLQKFDEFYSTFNLFQKQKLDLIIVERNLQRMVVRGISEVIGSTSEDRKGLESVNAFFSVPVFQRLLDLKPEQLEKEEEARSKLIDSVKEFDQDLTENVEKLFRRWQQALYQELVLFQQNDYDLAIGPAFEWPEILLKKGLHTKFDRNKFKFWNAKSLSHWATASPRGLDMIIITPTYIDAPIQPHALLELLLNQEFNQEIKLNQHQTARIKLLKEQWFENNPLPELLDHTFDFGWNRTSKEQREEAHQTDEEYGEFYRQINQVLDNKQQQRLKQIWNQILIEMGWKFVPLVFPDWRDYLSMSQSQRAKFDEINAKFIEEIQMLQADHLQQREKAAKEFNEIVSQLLTDEQKQKFQKFLTGRL